MKTPVKFLKTALLGFIILTGALSCVCEEEVGDNRELIDLTPVERQYLLKEMRQFLFSFNGVTNGITTNNMPMAAEEAYKSGGNFQAEGHVGRAPDTLNDKLPEGFQRLRSQSHANFDELAEAIKQGATDREVIAKSGNIMGNCVACHTRYRFR